MVFGPCRPMEGSFMVTTASNLCSKQPREQRGETRFPVAVPATAVMGGKNYSVRVVNVARGGAKFETSAQIAIGSKLTFRCGTIATGATAVWQSGACTGVSFDRPISTRDVTDQLSRTSAVAAWQTRDRVEK